MAQGSDAGFVEEELHGRLVLPLGSNSPDGTNYHMFCERDGGHAAAHIKPIHVCNTSHQADKFACPAFGMGANSPRTASTSQCRPRVEHCTDQHQPCRHGQDDHVTHSWSERVKIVDLAPNLRTEAMALGRWTTDATFLNHYYAPLLVASTPVPAALKNNPQQVLRWGWKATPPVWEHFL